MQGAPAVRLREEEGAVGVERRPAHGEAVGPRAVEDAIAVGEAVGAAAMEVAVANIASEHSLHVSAIGEREDTNAAHLSIYPCSFAATARRWRACFAYGNGIAVRLPVRIMLTLKFVVFVFTFVL
jgi:hypothetical protein